MTNRINASRGKIIDKVSIDDGFRQVCLDNLYDLLGDDPRFRLSMLQEALDPVNQDLDENCDMVINAMIDALSAESEKDLTMALYKIGFVVLSGYLLNEEYTQETTP
jgi:hypothetical protein